MAITIITDNLTPGYVGRNYQCQLLAQADPTSDVVWEILNELPPNLELDKKSGIIKGFCERSYLGSLEISVYDIKTGSKDKRILNLYIYKASTPTISTNILPDGTVCNPYNARLWASGGLPPYKWSITGLLPNGLQLSNEQITGNPVSVGRVDIKVKVTDSANPPSSSEQDITINILEALAINTSLPYGTVDKLYVSKLQASGGLAPYQWSISGLPNELQLSNGQITGKPVSVGEVDIKVKVTDSANPPSSSEKDITISILEVLAINISLPYGIVNKPYFGKLLASGGLAPYKWSISGLPNGLQLSNGQITGIPVPSGEVDIKVKVTDSANPPSSDEQDITISILEALTINTSLPYGTVNKPYVGKLQASGGVAPYQWSISGLPNGLQLSDEQITGTPVSSGKIDLKVEVTDSANPPNSCEQDITFILGTLTINTTMLSGFYRQPYVGNLNASGGLAPYQWSISGLPNGLQLSNGQITGKPALVGTVDMKVKVTDSANPPNSCEKDITFRIDIMC